MSWTDYCNQLVGDGKVVAAAAVFALRDQVLGYSPNFYAACAGVRSSHFFCPGSIAFHSFVFQSTKTIQFNKLCSSDFLCISHTHTQIQYDYTAEVNSLAGALANPSLAQASGIKVGNVKYMFIRSHVQDQSADPFLTGNKVSLNFFVARFCVVFTPTLHRFVIFPRSFVPTSWFGFCWISIGSLAVLLWSICFSILGLKHTGWCWCVGSPDQGRHPGRRLGPGCRRSVRYSALQGRSVAHQRQLVKKPSFQSIV